MSGLAAALQASMAAGPPAKRRHTDAATPSDMLGDLRARLDEANAAESRRDEAEAVANATRGTPGARSRDDPTDDEPAGGGAIGFAAMDWGSGGGSSRPALTEYAEQLLAREFRRLNAIYQPVVTARGGQYNNHRNCFMCRYGKREFDGTVDEGCYAYIRMLQCVEENVQMPRGQVALDLEEIFDTHFWEPACQARGGHPPLDVPYFGKEEAFFHLTHHLLMHPDLTLQRGMESMHNLINAAEANIKNEDGVFDPKVADTIIKANTSLQKMNHEWREHIKNSGTKLELRLDPRKLALAGSIRRIEPMLRRTGNALGTGTGQRAGATVRMLTRTVVSSGGGDEEEEEEEEPRYEPVVDTMDHDQEEEEEEEEDEDDIDALLGF